MNMQVKEARLMPEFFEWPRFEDGEQVNFGDKFITDSGHEGTVYRIEFLKEQTNIWSREGSNIGITALTDGERVKRPAPKVQRTKPCPVCGCEETPYIDSTREKSTNPYGYSMACKECGHEVHGEAYDDDVKAITSVFEAWNASEAPKVLDADGVEIRVGDTLYKCDTRALGWELVPYVVSQIQRGRIDLRHPDEDEPEFFGVEPGRWTHEKPVLAADGKPIEVGQTLYDYDGHAFEVVALHPGDAYDVEVDGEWHVNASGEKEPKRVKANWLTHKKPVLAADGKPINVGDIVYALPSCSGKPHPEGFEVTGLGTASTVYAKTSDDTPVSFRYGDVTHEKPEPADTWEQLMLDAELGTSAYIEKRKLNCPSINARHKSVRADIVARAKALAERGAE